MLADKNTTAADKSLSSFLFFLLVVPRTCKLNIHSNGGAYRFSTEVERGVTGHNFSKCECANIAHLCLVSSDFAAFDHFVELHTCSNTCEVTAFVDRSECIVEIINACGMSLSTGCMAELNIRILLSSVNKE